MAAPGSPPPITLAVLGDASDLNRTLQAVLKNLGDFKGQAASAGKAAATVDLGGLLSQVGEAVALFETLKTGWEGVKKSFSEAGDAEAMETRFKVLLGSAEAAAARMRELKDVASNNPIALPELAEASAKLQLLTKGALAGSDGLKLVAGISMGTGASLDRTARLVGFLYTSLQSGAPVQRATTQLQKMGVIAPAVAQQLQRLNAAGVKGDAAWSVAEKALGGYGTALTAQAGTWNGLLKILWNNVDAVFREFGTPLLDAFKPILTGAISLLKTLTPLAAQLGQQIAAAMGTVSNLFKNGDIGQFLLLSLRIGASEGVNYLLGGLRTAAAIFGDLLMGGVKAAFSPSFAVGIQKIFLDLAGILSGVAIIFTATILEGLEKPIEYVAAGFGFAADIMESGLKTAGALFVNVLLSGMQKAVDLLSTVAGVLHLPGADALAAQAAGLQKLLDLTSEGVSVSAPSFDQELQKYQAIGGRAIPAAADAVRGVGKTVVSNAGSSLATDASGLYSGYVAPVVGDALKDAKNFKPVKLLDDSADQKQLAALVAKNAPGAKPADTTKYPGTGLGTIDPYVGKVAPAKGDSLTDIGGGGGVSGATMDDLKSEAAKQTTILETIATNTGAAAGLTPSVISPGATADGLTAGLGNTPAIGGASSESSGFNLIAGKLDIGNGLMTRMLAALESNRNNTANYPGSGAGLIIERTG